MFTTVVTGDCDSALCLPSHYYFELIDNHILDMRRVFLQCELPLIAQGQTLQLNRFSFGREEILDT